MSLINKFLTREQIILCQKSKIDTKIEDLLVQIFEEDITPEDGQVQIFDLLKLIDNPKNELSFDNYKEYIDEGDYIQASGHLDYSKSGEASMFVDNYLILTKAVRPLPDKMEYDNTESRYLDRVADFKMNTKDEKGLSVRDIIRHKSKYWAIWREEMINEGFLEVECPIFEGTPGGAEAKPFTTFYNELDQDMYLRISLELPLKKLISGGFEKVFEIGRIFRNEGSSPQHLQEYTQIEWYCAYRDYIWAAELTKRVYQRCVQEIIGSMIQIDYNGNQINWGEWCSEAEGVKNNWKMIGGWPCIPYFEAVRLFSNGEIDTENKTELELCDLGKKFDLNLTPELGLGTLLDKLWKKARINTRNPFFLVLPPVELEPLAKRDPSNLGLTQRWQVVAGGAELGKAFSELNDPVDQFGRFEEQQKARDAGNDEAQFMDTKYVEAMEYGMPPMAGFGTSERFVSFLLGKHIRECVTFPHIRSEEPNSTKPTQKSKDPEVIHAIVLNSDDVPMWSQMNTAAQLSASLAARQGSKLVGVDKSVLIDGNTLRMNIATPMTIKATKDSAQLLNLQKQSVDLGLEISIFTQEMQNSSNQKVVCENLAVKTSQQTQWLGIMIIGPRSTVESLTKSFERYI